MTAKETIARLRALGVAEAAIPGVMEMLDEREAEGRRPRTTAERSRAHRQVVRNDSETISLRESVATVAPALQERVEDVAAAAAPRARVLYGPEVSKIPLTNPTGSIPKGEKRETPTECLASVVGQELAAEIVDHRKRKRSPLTNGAAKRLASRLAQADNPQDAARFMIDKGWTGFQPEWMENARGRGPPGGRSPPRESKLTSHTKAAVTVFNELSALEPDESDDDGPFEAAGGYAPGGRSGFVGRIGRA